MTVTQYGDMVVARYKDHLTMLYNMGARKIAVASLIPTGCCPFRLTLALTRNGQCDDEANTHVLYINKGILRVVYELNGDLPGAAFTYIDVYRALGEIIAQPQAYVQALRLRIRRAAGWEGITRASMDACST